MLKHGDIWRAIDGLAAAHGLSPSGLARKAGLDPTTFNRSKRVSVEGKQRWPSTESVAKVLEATGASLADFVALVGEAPDRLGARRIPVVGMAEAGGEGIFDEAGHPASGQPWDEALFPDLGDPHAYALEIVGDSMEPVYRDGDIVVVSPNASVRRGDRVVVRIRNGEVLAKQLQRISANRIELASLNRADPDRVLAVEDILWMARIVWASQ